MRLIRVGRRVAEAFAAAMLAAMFAAFLLQIFSRYVMVQPFGWTLELCLALWVWLVFWGNATIVDEKDHVTFDILYLAVPDGLRRVFALVSAAAVAGVLLWSLLPTWDWIEFLKIKRSATLRGVWPDWSWLDAVGIEPGKRFTVRMRTIYSIYGVFLVAVALRHIWAFVRVLRHGAPREAHEIHVGEDG